MKLSCSSQSLDRLFESKKMDIFQYIQYAKNTLKLDGIEIEDKHFESTTPEYLSKIKAELDNNGLEYSNMAYFNSFGYPTKEENDEELARATKWMDVAVALGSKNFRIFAGWMGGPDMEIGKSGGPLPKPEEAWNTMVHYIDLVCENAKEKSLNVVIENHNHGGFLSSSKDVEKLFSQLKSGNITLLLDTGNYVDGIEGIEKTVHLAKNHVHLKCNVINEDGSDDMYDIDKILSIIKESGYNGNISIEYEGTQDELTYLPKIIEFARKRI